MRHRKNFNHLGRKSAHRKAMLGNIASSLIIHKRIQTTTAKAKALKRYIEPLITRSKDDSTHSRRVVFSYLQDKEAVSELFRDVASKVADRPGGYTRIIKLGSRQGDNADMCLIELVDYNENLLAEKAADKKSSSRRRRGSGSKPKAEAVTEADAVTEPEAVTATEGTEVQAEEPEAVTEAPTEGTEVQAEEQPATEADAVTEAEPEATGGPESESKQEDAEEEADDSEKKDS